MAFSKEQPDIAYFQQPTISFDWEELEAIKTEFSDTTGLGAVYTYWNSEGLPVCYGQDIFTSVCFDNQCRPLNLMLFWNITGRYLGFRLPKEEFLSRYDHEPFSDKDYQELNSLLSDPYLPFSNFAFEDLIDYRDVGNEDIDGVSGATSNRLAEYVVEGAAYTTYTMWNIVHGPMQKLLQEKTELEMTNLLLSFILQSPVSDDIIWGLGKIDQSRELDTILVRPMLDLMDHKDFFVAYSVIEAISSEQLKSEDLQVQLFQKYSDIQYSLKKEILNKLAGAPTISKAVIETSREMLGDLNGQQLDYMLELYRNHKIDDLQTSASVAVLLHSDNKFVSRKAFDHLSQIEHLDDEILQKMKDYSIRNK